jgi:hypothetical protein
MIFDSQPPGLPPIMLDLLEAEWLGTVAGLSNFMQNLEWDLQFTGGHVIGLAGFPKNDYQWTAVSMAQQTPGDCDRIADTAVSIQGLTIPIIFRKYYPDIFLPHNALLRSWRRDSLNNEHTKIFRRRPKTDLCTPIGSLCCLFCYLFACSLLFGRPLDRLCGNDFRSGRRFLAGGSRRDHFLL